MRKITLRSNLLNDKKLGSVNIKSLTNQAVSTLFAKMIFCMLFAVANNVINLLNIMKYSLVTKHLYSLIIDIKQKVSILSILCFKKIVFCFSIDSNLRDIFEDLKRGILFDLLINQIKYPSFYSGIAIIKYNVKINREII